MEIIKHHESAEHLSQVCPTSSTSLTRFNITVNKNIGFFSYGHLPKLTRFTLLYSATKNSFWQIIFSVLFHSFPRLIERKLWWVKNYMNAVKTNFTHNFYNQQRAIFPKLVPSPYLGHVITEGTGMSMMDEILTN